MHVTDWTVVINRGGEGKKGIFDEFTIRNSQTRKQVQGKVGTQEGRRKDTTRNISERERISQNHKKNVAL